MPKDKEVELSKQHRDKLVGILNARFEANMHRHKGIKWTEVAARLAAQPEKLWSLHEMEKTGGEPDVIGYDKKSGAYLFCDCSPESPTDRRSLCYDDEALESRKKNKPKNSAMGMATDMGIEVLTKEDYRALQALENFDLKTSSWVDTPPEIRKLGGAIFCDLRFGRIFTYHNGAESYYGSRGFRGTLRI